MRKEDRIVAGRQPGSSSQPSQDKPQPRPQEQIKSGGSSAQPPKPTRTPGKMPLPE